jgi:hypothetical protein
MAYFLNEKRFVEETLPNGQKEHREIQSFYIDDPADVDSLPGRDTVDETSTAFCPKNGMLWVLMSDGWIPM